MESEFLLMMPLTVKLAPKSSNSGVVGELSYGAVKYTPHCHIEQKAAIVVDRYGVERPQEGMIYLDGVYPLNTEFQLQIPEPGDTWSTVKIIQVFQNTDDVGYHHTALSYGRY